MTGNSGTLGGTTRFASTEVAEPSQFALGKSVWYRWQPTISGAATISVGIREDSICLHRGYIGITCLPWRIFQFQLLGHGGHYLSNCSNGLVRFVRAVLAKLECAAATNE